MSRRQRAATNRAALLRDAGRAARAAQLRYVPAGEPGIERRRSGKGFVYVSGGKVVRDRRQLRRIAALAIPPAWTDVWICRDEHGHVQATGRDARGRKQYRYHARWRRVRDEAKFDDMLLFARQLPALRRRIKRDLSAPHLNREKVLATLLRIMAETKIRVGNDEYLQANRSHGLTTLLDQHARVSGGTIEFRFRGKGGKPYRASLRDRRLAAIVKRCRDLPGQRLFQYVDEHGRFRAITSTDVNEYIQAATGQPFTAKQFRTWAATLDAALLLCDCAPCRTGAEAKRVSTRVLENVAERLGNTPSICRKCYVHPDVLAAHADGRLHAAFQSSVKQARGHARRGLSLEESAVVALLERLQRAA